jgi:phosphoglycolate phosphatase
VDRPERTVTAPQATATARRVQAVVFDLDGTLVDSYGAISESLNHARAGWRLPPLDEGVVRAAVGHGLESLIAEHCGPDRVEAGVRRFREHYARIFLRCTHALPGVGATLARLARRGLRVAVASNKPARFTAPILEHLDLARYVDAVHGPDTVGRTKPDPVMIRACLADLGVDARAAIYVGDMVLDVESGRRAGVRVALVAGGSSPAEDLRATGATVLDGIASLCTLLDDPDLDGRPGGDDR